MSTQTIVQRPSDEELGRRALAVAEKVRKQVARKWPEFADDAFGEAALGAWEAAKEWDPARDAKFETFAEWRAMGQYADAARKERPKGYRQRDDEKRGEVPPVLSLDATWVRGEVVNEMSWGELVGVEDDHSDLREMVEDLCRRLPTNCRTVIRALYCDPSTPTMKLVGQALGMSESRVSQIHTKAIAMLRESLGVEAGEAPAPPAANDRRRRILELLRDRGRMTKREVADELGCEPDRLCALVAPLAWAGWVQVERAAKPGAPAVYEYVRGLGEDIAAAVRRHWAHVGRARERGVSP